MLRELRDQHVSIEHPDGRRLSPFQTQPDPNYDYPWVGRALSDLEQIGPQTGFVGRTREGLEVLRVFRSRAP